MWLVKNKIVLGMALLRCLSGLIEFTAAMLMLKFDSVEKAVKINAVLAVIGPTVLIVVTSIGLVGLSQKGFSVPRFLLIVAGVTLIFIGIGKGK